MAIDDATDIMDEKLQPSHLTQFLENTLNLFIRFGFKETRDESVIVHFFLFRRDTQIHTQSRGSMWVCLGEGHFIQKVTDGWSVEDLPPPYFF